MRCLLVATNKVRTPYPVYPLALACLAGALIDAGHQVEQYDCLVEEEIGCQSLEDIITRFAPELIGLSIRNLDLEDSSRPESFVDHAMQVMSRIREHTASPVVLGGAAFSLMPERFMDILKPEYGVVGEGERQIVDLVDLLAAGKFPEQKLFHVPLSSYPGHQVAYDRRIIPFYLQWGGILNVQTKRGCPFKCAYCGYPLLEGNGVRSRDPLSVVEEVRRLERDFQARYIFFTDSVFNDPEEKYLEICEALIRNGNRLPWMAYFRPASMQREHMAIMKRSGLDAMEVGTDCGCDITLHSLNKGFSINDAIRFNELAADFEIPCAHFIMFGAPNETRETVLESLANLERMEPAVLMAFLGIRILPRTSIHAQAVADGIVDEGQDLLKPVYYFSPAIGMGEVKDLIRQSWQDRTDRVCPGAYGAEKVAMLHKRGFVGPIWDRLLRLGTK